MRNDFFFFFNNINFIVARPKLLASVIVRLTTLPLVIARLVFSPIVIASLAFFPLVIASLAFFPLVIASLAPARRSNPENKLSNLFNWIASLTLAMTLNLFCFGAFNQAYCQKKEVVKIEDSNPQKIANEGFADIAEKLIPTVVNISATKVNKQNVDLSFLNDLPPNHPFYDLKERVQKNPELLQTQNISVGSGFIISADGFITTNNHVIENAKEILVSLDDGTKYKAKIVGFDAKTDLAVLKIDTKKNLDFVKFGDSTKARIGDWVIAVGNPYGLGGSVSVGIISSNKRSVNQIDDFIQTDAAINKGNSGGPLFNTKGEVIAVSSALFSPSGGNVGIGFANPSFVVEPIIKQLKENGEVVRGWIGLSVQNLNDELIKTLQEKNKKIPLKGVFVIEVSANSPAFEAKIQQGDIITKFADLEINDMKELPKIVAKLPVGKIVPVNIIRDGKAKKLEIKIGRLP